jgi:hypothetical protein
MNNDYVDGEPRFEVYNNDDVVDTIRVGRYDIPSLK